VIDDERIAEVARANFELRVIEGLWSLDDAIASHSTLPRLVIVPHWPRLDFSIEADAWEQVSYL
jgi:hypothetical protein